MEPFLLDKRSGKYCIVNVSDLIDVSLVIMSSSSKEEILEFYTDLFPSDLSRKDIEHYFDDCEMPDEDSRKVMMEKLGYIVDLLRTRKKWITADGI